MHFWVVQCIVISNTFIMQPLLQGQHVPDSSTNPSLSILLVWLAFSTFTYYPTNHCFSNINLCLYFCVICDTMTLLASFVEWQHQVWRRVLGCQWRNNCPCRPCNTGGPTRVGGPCANLPKKLFMTVVGYVSSCLWTQHNLLQIVRSLGGGPMTMFCSFCRGGGGICSYATAGCRCTTVNIYCQNATVWVLSLWMPTAIV